VPEAIDLREGRHGEIIGNLEDQDTGAVMIEDEAGRGAGVKDGLYAEDGPEEGFTGQEKRKDEKRDLEDKGEPAQDLVGERLEKKCREQRPRTLEKKGKGPGENADFPLEFLPYPLAAFFERARRGLEHAGIAFPDHKQRHGQVVHDDFFIGREGIGLPAHRVHGSVRAHA